MSQIEENPVKSKAMKAKYEVVLRLLKVESDLGYKNNLSLYFASLQIEENPVKNRKMKAK